MNTSNTSKKTRLEANRILLSILSDYIERYPDQRFGQALFNLGFVQRLPNSLAIQDPFYEESTKTLERMNQEERKQIVQAWYKAKPEEQFEWCVCGQPKEHCICNVSTNSLPTIPKSETISDFLKKTQEKFGS